MNPNNKTVPPLPKMNMKAPNVDAKGLPLRMSNDVRRLDQPFARVRKIQLKWSYPDGVSIEMSENGPS